MNTSWNKRMERWLQVVPSRMEELTTDTLLEKPDPDKWSKLEIMGHLCDSAQYNLMRFSAAQETSKPFHYDPYPQDALVSINRYHDLPLSHVLQFWSSLNRQIMYVVENLSMSQLNQEMVYNGKSGEEVFSLDFMIQDYVKHLEHHIQQLFPDKELENI